MRFKRSHFCCDHSLQSQFILWPLHLFFVFYWPPPPTVLASCMLGLVMMWYPPSRSLFVSNEFGSGAADHLHCVTVFERQMILTSQYLCAWKSIC